MRHLRRHAVGYLALFVALSGTSFAAVSTFTAGDGSVKVCVKKSSGATRVVTPKADCRKKERTLSINQQGRRGPAGAVGATGAPGAKGAKGDTGTVDTSQFFSKTESDARFVGGTGHYVHRRFKQNVTSAAPNAQADLLVIPGELTVRGTCSQTYGATVSYKNTTAGDFMFFYDVGDSSASESILKPGGEQFTVDANRVIKTLGVRTEDADLTGYYAGLGSSSKLECTYDIAGIVPN